MAGMLVNRPEPRMLLDDALWTVSQCAIVPVEMPRGVTLNPRDALLLFASRAQGTSSAAWHRATHLLTGMLKAWPAGAIESDLASVNAALDAIGQAAEEHGIRWWEVQP